MALSLKQLKDVCCLNGGHKQCSYLDEDVNDKGFRVHVCKKLSPDQQIIDDEIVDFLNEMKKTGQDPNKQSVPLGNNCKGYIVLKNKLQGYDI